MIYRKAKPVRHLVAVTASACGLVAASMGLGAGSAVAQPNPADWPAFLYDTGHSSYNAAATAITPANVSSLTRAWQWVTPASPNTGSNGLFASPTVVNGVVYIGAEDGYFYAISEASQTVLWSRFLGLEVPLGTGSCIKHAQGIIATATVADDPTTGNPTVYVNAPDGNLYALDAQTGAVAWSGLVDTPSTIKNDYYSWSSPLVANGKVYVGISSDSDCPLVPGGLVAFDQHTGTQVARWIDVPNVTGPKHLGGSIWSSPALLADGDIAVATGNAYFGTGQSLYNESIVRLDPNTLNVLDWWQIPSAQQINDSDFGSSPTVWTATINGVSTPMVGACNKNGIFYALAQDDLSAGPVWQTQITVPYPGGTKLCDSSAVYDGNQLIIGGGAATTINGTTYAGSVQSLNPATGVPNWQTGLPATIVGTPTENGGGVVAAQTYSTTSSPSGVYLLNAATGANVGFIHTGQKLFGQAVFDQSDLIIAAGGKFGMQAFTVP
jgi:polyvinyl alcohol dehydrogenase (cytochrome)